MFIFSIRQCRQIKTQRYTYLISLASPYSIYRDGEYHFISYKYLLNCSCKGYIRKDPFLVPIANNRCMGSNARAVGWYGKP